MTVSRIVAETCFMFHVHIKFVKLLSDTFWNAEGSWLYFLISVTKIDVK